MISEKFQHGCRFYQPPKKSSFIAVHFGGIYFGTELAVLQEGLVDDLSVAQQEHGGLVTSRLAAGWKKVGQPQSLCVSTNLSCKPPALGFGALWPSICVSKLLGIGTWIVYRIGMDWNRPQSNAIEKGQASQEVRQSNSTSSTPKEMWNSQCLGTFNWFSSMLQYVWYSKR